ncbi:hypothetical protein [Peptostreptococcus canis]|uniref:Secreted protein n=1 Tax=Peptostreptococcus canis TaxID=1159213 RepID=A0ABR6TKV1_9FIRM|nr:hypothetical protein [Peptostreptococcus canis]MBC2576035.1 hypothetical protein [Peptostreptococcus canis]MBP1997840.1 hypothetical protein [Peptostreptococcus canis]
MKKKIYLKRIIGLVMALVVISVLSFGDINAVGCSAWQRISTGKPYVTNTYCPGGKLRRKVRQDKYRRKCLRNNGSIYYEYKYKTVFLGCV